MKTLKRLSDSDLWYLGYYLCKMMQDIHRYFAWVLEYKHNPSQSGEPYNAINDGIEDQNDMMTYYLKVKDILEPLFDEEYKSEKEKYKKLKEKIREAYKILDDKND